MTTPPPLPSTRRRASAAAEHPGAFVKRRFDFVTANLRVVRRLPGVTGVLLGTVDGRTLLSDISESTPGSAAAIAASSLALAARLGDLTDEDAVVEELQVRSEAGYVCLYVISPEILLAVVANHAVNLARLKLETRTVIEDFRRELSSSASTEQQP